MNIDIYYYKSILNMSINICILISLKHKIYCNIPKYTLVVLNKIRVYYKCILKFFVIIILLSEKILKPENCTRYKGKSGICQNRI